jgi:hypothetical protein
MSWSKYVIKDSKPLVYSQHANECKNVLLIDSAIKDAQLFSTSVNSSTMAITYSYSSKKTELLTLLKSNFTAIQRIAICFTSGKGGSKTFLDNKSFFEPENLEFLVSLIKELGVKNIDFLGCNTLKYSNWTEYYKGLTVETGVIVGASSDKTGNIKHGGDWIMESTSENIEAIYFSKSIIYYSYLLDNPVLLKNFRLDYENGVYVLLTIDVNNFYNFIGFAPGLFLPDWLKNFKLYDNNTLLYNSLNDLGGLVIIDNSGQDTINGLLQQPIIGIWTTDENVYSVGENLLNINSTTYGTMNLTRIVEVTVAPICFPAGTPIQTDQGLIPIDKIDNTLHSINNKRIVSITKTITNESYLVCFEKHSLGYNYPSQKTIMSKQHRVFFNGSMIPAHTFIGNFKNIKQVKYNGELLYNVLMNNHSTMKVNNMLCETLHPENAIAKLYRNQTIQ